MQNLAQDGATTGDGAPLRSPDTALTAIQLRLPPFWPKNPRVWITQIEAQFHLHRITSQLSRFYYVVASLPPAVADELDDILSRPPPDDAYDHLKGVLLERTTASERTRIQQLLTAQELGDRRPSQLLHQMRQLLGPQTPGSQDPILRELFLQKLPQGIRMVLAAADDMPLDRLAMLADRTAEYASPSIATITPQEPPAWETALTRLEARIEARMEQLSCAVAAVRPSHETPSRRTRRDMSQTRSSSRRTSRSADRSLCWYHRRYAERATRCHQPCSWSGNPTARH